MNNLNILLINSAYVKKRSTVMANVEDNILTPAIFIAQDVNIQTILGTNLYDEMIGEFNDYRLHTLSGGTDPITTFVESRFITLVDNYIQPCVLFWTLTEVAYDLYQKNTNKGMVTQSSTDNSDPVDFKIVEKRKAEWKNKAEYYSERLLKYLINNSSTYPLFYSANTDIQSKSSTNYFCGLYLR